MRDGLKNVYKCLLGGSEDKDAEPFSVVSVARARGSGHKLKNRKLHLSTSKHFFPGEGGVKHWNRFYTEAVDSPGRCSKPNKLYVVLDNLL